MYLVAGLGNPGEKYENTRHNVGFKLISKLAEKYKFNSRNFKGIAVTAKGRIKGEKVMMAQPLTYMNRSGKAINKLINYYKIDLNKILIVYDDLDLPVGKIRLRKKGSSGGHKGLKSIINHFSTKDFNRLRIGIDRPPARIPVENYVLSGFKGEEKEIIEKTLEKAIGAVELFLEEGIDKAMNYYN